MRLNLTVPDEYLPADSAVFDQNGKFINSGSRESCEQLAESISGLFCWIDKGRAVIRRDFEPAD